MQLMQILLCCSLFPTSLVIITGQEQPHAIRTAHRPSTAHPNFFTSTLLLLPCLPFTETLSSDPNYACQMIKAPLCSWVQKCSAGHIGIVWEVLPASMASGCSSPKPAPCRQVRGISSSLMCHNCKPRHEAALRDNQNIKHPRVCPMALPTKWENKTVLFIPDSNGDLLLSTHQGPRGSIPYSVPQDAKQIQIRHSTWHAALSPNYSKIKDSCNPTHMD